MLGSMGLGLMGFEEDPFASSHRMFRQMDNLMGSMMGGGMRDPFQDPFFSGRANVPAITNVPAIMGSLHPHSSNRSLAVNRMDPFANMMTAMESASRQGSSHSFSSSTVMSMSNGPNGQPQIYQSSTSSRGLPGGIKETQSTITDSRTGTRKMAIGRHLGDRSYVKEKEMNREGELEEKDEYVNMDEEELGQFEAEFQRRSGQASAGALNYSRYHGSPSRQRNMYMPALPSTSSRQRIRPLMAITSRPSRNDDMRYRQKEKGTSRRGRTH